MKMKLRSFAKKIYHVLKKKGYQNNSKYHKILRINQISEEVLHKTGIVVYFFGGMGQTYQINQWIDTFTELNKKHKITIVVRDYRVYRFWKKHLSFDIYYCYAIDDLMNFYKKYTPKVIIYINNGFKNFQSLIYEDGLHIHINHGESDKSSDHSNQVKSYDYIFVHGPNGYNNYMKYLIKLDPGKLVQTGRPQLDFIKPIKLDTKNKQVVIYAPTYEATHRSMRYTSVDVYGKKIVDQILESEKYFLIYKPHPNLGGNDPEVSRIHKEFMTKIKKNENAIMINNEDVNNIYPLVDFAIFDMSSIMTDYLYVNKPFLLADVFKQSVHNIAEYNILDGCNRITLNNIDNLLEIIEDEISNDPMKEKREAVKKLYLGEYKKGESIEKFISCVSDAIRKRDLMIEKKMDPQSKKIISREPNRKNKLSRLEIEKKMDPQGKKIISREPDRKNKLSRLENGNEDIAIYFFGDMSSVYQFDQFRKVFEYLNTQKTIRIVVRNLNVYRYIKNSTIFKVAYAYTLDDLLTYYEDNDFKVIFYFNDGVKNFQSLIYHRALHIYLDFGNNDNYISHSNQSKSYDYVYFSGQEEYKVYDDNLIGMNSKNYQATGDILDYQNDRSRNLFVKKTMDAITERDLLLTQNNMLNTIH